MTQQEHRDIAHLYGQTPHGILCTLVETRNASYLQPGTRMYATAAGNAGSVFHEALLTIGVQAGEGARMQALGDAAVLIEHSSTLEVEALMEACVAALAGELRVVATILPEGEMSLLRFVMDERGDVLFASELLETEDIVPLRRVARTSAHGVVHASLQGRLFVERMEPFPVEKRIIENDTSHAEAE
jgi:hypothetical protein